MRIITLSILTLGLALPVLGQQRSSFPVAVREVEGSPVAVSRPAIPLKSAHQRIDVTVNLPLELTPTSEDFNYFTVVDANNDGKVWSYKSNFNGFVSPSNDKMDCDDWLIFPAVNFDASKTYELSFMLAANMKGEFYRSAFEVYVGPDKNPANMVKYGNRIDFYSSTGRLDQAEGPFAAEFGISGESGVRYVAIRCVTPMLEKVDNPDNWKGYDEYSSWPASVRNISLKETSVSAQTPKQPEITVTPAPNGVLSANVAFTMPTECMNGEPLRPAQAIVATITTPAETKTVTQLPGTPVSVDIATLQGVNTVSVRVDSDEEGSPVSKDVYTGVYEPNRVHDLTAILAPDNMSMTLTWTPPTTAKNNGYFDPALCTYGVYRQNAYYDYDLVEDLGNSLTYTYTVSAAEPQATHTVYILPSNAAGRSDDTTNWVGEDKVSITAVLGTPHALPMREDFTGLTVAYPPLRNERPDGAAGRVVLQDPSGYMASEDGAALFAYNPLTEDATMARAATPKISTKGVHNAALSLSHMCLAGYTSTIDVYVLAHDTEPVLLAKLNTSTAVNNGWKETTLPLPAEFQDREWVQFYFDFDLPDVDYVGAIDWYGVAHTADNDLALTALAAPAGIAAGSEAQFTATVYNTGINTLVPEMSLEVYADGEFKSGTSQELETALESGKSTDVTLTYTPPVDYLGKSLQIKVSVKNEADQVEANNSKTVDVELRKPECPIVTDLHAAGGEDHVLLTWSEPSLSRMTVESFEHEEGWNYGENIAGFRNVDMDKQSVYKFSNNSMPHENTPKAFMVAVHSEMQSPEGLESHSGQKELMVTCPEQLTSDQQPMAADDWLISPLTEGDRYFSFWVNIISATYPETFEILASSTGREPSDFTEKIGTFTKARTGWEQMEYKTPEDAKYFAIHYVSRNMFGAFIDDIRYSDPEYPHQLEKYAVYRNFELIGYTTETNYRDYDVNEGESHIYFVTAHSDGIEHPISNVELAQVKFSGLEGVQAASSVSGLKGAVSIKGYAGCKAVVTDMAGRTLANGTLATSDEQIPLAAGIYAVSIEGDTVKVIVR